MKATLGLRVLREDPEWLNKLFVALVLLFIPLAGPIALAGWTSLLVRGLASGRPTSWRPRLAFDFDYLIKLATIGWKPFVARLLWSLPVSFIFAFFYVITLLLTAGVLAATTGPNGEPSPVGFLIPLIFILVALPLILAGTVPAIVAMVRVEVTGDLKYGLDFGGVMAATRPIFGAVWGGLLRLVLVSIPLAWAGVLCCYVGIFPMAAVLLIMQAFFQTEVYRVYLERGGAPLPIAAHEVEAMGANVT